MITRDETQDMWIWEDGGDCLGVCQYDERLNDDGEEVGAPEAERYVRYADLQQYEAIVAAATELVDATDDFFAKQHTAQSIWKKADTRLKHAERELKRLITESRATLPTRKAAGT